MDDRAIDLLLIAGGDGTILRSIRELHSLATPIVSINRGSVGFLTEMTVQETDDVLPLLLQGEGMVDERQLLSVSVERDGEVVFDSFALNEAAISQGAISRLLDLRTMISGEPLATFHADGLIVATPTGSTAYSLAAGGPVVHPRLPAMILTPINPYSLTQKPIVIPGSSVVKTDVIRETHDHLTSFVSMTLDGQVYFELQKDDTVTVRLHGETVKFLRRKEDTFYRTLRMKLKWGEA
jgi:NAD+ kinase